jgi:hypothetical protein
MMGREEKTKRIPSTSRIFEFPVCDTLAAREFLPFLVMRSPRRRSFLSHGRKKRTKERPPAASPRLKNGGKFLKRANALRLNEPVSSRNFPPFFFTPLRRGRSFVLCGLEDSRLILHLILLLLYYYFCTITKVSDISESFINRSLRQLVGKTRWVFRQPNGSNPTNHPV